jgi:hypothetical protein
MLPVSAFLYSSLRESVDRGQLLGQKGFDGRFDHPWGDTSTLAAAGRHLYSSVGTAARE